MDDAKRRYTDDVPADFEVRLRERCLALPDAYEERAWVGTRWMVRKRTFAHVLGVDVHGGPLVVLSFRSTGDELEVLRNAGHPFFVLGWGRDAIGMVLDTATDWDEVRELLIESYCVLAPQKLIALVDRPNRESAGHDGGVIGLQRISAGLSGPQIHSSSTGMNPMPM